MEKQIQEPDFHAIREKRVKTLIGVWDSLVSNGKIDPRRQNLSTPLINEVVEHYIADLIVLRIRYKIENSKIQLHKIAGLIAASILRYRPVIPLVESFNSDYELYANEILAVMHGIAICGEYTEKDGPLEIIDEDWFDQWLKDFLYLMHCRHTTPESLIFIFETLCCLRFPKNIKNISE